MKKAIFSAKILATLVAICLLATFMPINSGKLTVNAKVNSGNCPANVQTNLFNSRNYVSLKGNDASKTVSFCVRFQPGKIKIKSKDTKIGTVTYKVAGTSKTGKVLFINVKYKKAKQFQIAMNNMMEDWTQNVPASAIEYKKEISSFKIGSKKYNATKSYCYTGAAINNKKVKVTPKSGLKVKCLYVVDNFEWVRKNTSYFSIKKKYANGAKVTVPNGCSLHAVLSTGGSNEPDFCIYTANGSASSSSTSSSSTSTSSTSNAPAQVKIVGAYTNYENSGSTVLEWKTVSGVDGYQVDVCSESSFSKNVYTRTYSSTVYACGTKGTSGSTAYFRVRAYKTVDGKKVYGKWSAVKSAKM